MPTPRLSIVFLSAIALCAADLSIWETHLSAQTGSSTLPPPASSMQGRSPLAQGRSPLAQGRSPLAQFGQAEALPAGQSAGFKVETRPLEVRIKDITEIEGVRSHFLSGFGLVVGLAGTGSEDVITKSYALSLFENDNQLPAEIRENFQTLLKTKNLSVVRVSAELPPFAFPGQKVDLNVMVMDSATSLRGGTLIRTALYGIDKQIYAIGRGKVFVGGFSASGQGATVQQNVVSSGTIPGGAVIEATLCQENLGAEGFVNFHLRNEDRATAVRIQEAINRQYPDKAEVVNQQTIRVDVPVRQTQTEMEKFLAKIQEIKVTPDLTAKVIVNEHAGTIVITENATLKPVAITIGNLTIATTESPRVSQPAPFSQGDTQVIPQTNITVSEDQTGLRILPGSRTLRELVDGLNTLGISAREMSSILAAIKKSGSLQAELIFE